jgi:hypothetical protein
VKTDNTAFADGWDDYLLLPAGKDSTPSGAP